MVGENREIYFFQMYKNALKLSMVGDNFEIYFSQGSNTLVKKYFQNTLNISCKSQNRLLHGKEIF